MQIYLLLNQQPHGPFSEEEVRARLWSGAISMNTIARCEGADEWKTLSVIFDSVNVKKENDSKTEKNPRLEAVQKHSSLSNHPPAWWKWILVFISSLVGSLVVMVSDHGFPSDFPSFIGRLLGGALPSFGVAMLIAIFVRGWAGVLTGIIIVAVLIGFNIYGLKG